MTHSRLRRGAGAWSPARVLGALALVIVACLEAPVGPEDQPFGRVGEVRIEVWSPLSGGLGRLQYVVEWSSSGPWRSTERIFYQGRLGDETVALSSGDRTSLSRSYATWIDLVNDTPSVALFGQLLSSDLAPICPIPTSHVTVSIIDRIRDDTVSWSRCSESSLPTLSGEGAGPDPNASRVVQAAALVRNFTLGHQRGFRYQYTGSMPFATVDRGDRSTEPLSVPRLIEDAQTWSSFWAELTGAEAPAPSVDFDVDLVLVAALGTRYEAGDSVEIRSVLPVRTGTQIQLWERRAGHFCTPARRTHVPYHVVVAPQVPRPIFFSNASLDTVPCG